jgi:hypothetical protein
MSLIISNALFKHGHPFEITGVSDCGAWERRERIDVLLCSLYAAKRSSRWEDWCNPLRQELLQLEDEKACPGSAYLS